MSTQIKPVDLTDIDLMSKLKNHLHGELNPSIKMAAKFLNNSNAQDVSDDESSDKVDNNGAAGLEKDGVEDYSQTVERDP